MDEQRTEGQKSFYLAQTGNAGVTRRLQRSWFKKSSNFRKNLPALVGSQ